MIGRRLMLSQHVLYQVLLNWLFDAVDGKQAHTAWCTPCTPCPVLLSENIAWGVTRGHPRSDHRDHKEPKQNNTNSANIYIFKHTGRQTPANPHTHPSKTSESSFSLSLSPPPGCPPSLNMFKHGLFCCIRQERVFHQPPALAERGEMARRRRRLVTPVHPQGSGIWVRVRADRAPGGEPCQAGDGGGHEGNRAPAGTVCFGRRRRFCLRERVRRCCRRRRRRLFTSSKSARPFSPAIDRKQAKRSPRPPFPFPFLPAVRLK